MATYVPTTSGVYAGSMYDPTFLNDSLVWDNTETITYKSRTTESTFTDYSVSGTVWFIIKKDMLPPSSPLLKMDLTVELPGRILQPLHINVKDSDVLQRADGTQWRVMLIETPANVDRRVHVVKNTKTI